MAVDVLWRQVEGSLVLQVQQCNASLYIKPSVMINELRCDVKCSDALEGAGTYLDCMRAAQTWACHSWTPVQI